MTWRRFLIALAVVAALAFIVFEVIPLSAMLAIFHTP